MVKGARAKLAKAVKAVGPGAVTRIVRKMSVTPRLEHQARVRELPIEPGLVLYESFAGNGMLCNPEAIFRELLRDPDLQQLRHVWVINDHDAYADTIREFRGNARVRFVKRGTTAYYRAVATAEVLVNNATFPPEVAKRPGQTYVNTWHGTPLKHMGYDEPGGAWSAANTVRNFLMADYLLSTSPYMSEVMYEGAYRLNNIAVGELVEVGYPRTDRQFLGDDERRAVRARLREKGVEVSDDDTLVLYAPTWKGESFHAPRDDAHELATRVAELERLLPPGHRVLVKAHQQVYAFAEKEPQLAGRLVPNASPTNEVLAVTDVLVTDYSSIFFDFLSTGRPILFHTPDVADYDASRGRYLPDDELPGPTSTTVEQLAAQLGAIGSGGPLDPRQTHGERHEAARARFAPDDDGGATRRVIDLVFHGRRPATGLRATAKDERQALLVYLGGMLSNGITSSGLNLVRTIDHDRYDVTVLVSHSNFGQRESNLAAIDPRARQVHRIGGWVPPKLDWVRKRRLLSGRLDTLSVDELRRLDDLLAAEWRRVFGSVRFDVVVDFSGYSPLWTYLLSVAPAGSRAVFQHNDLAADQRREIGGHRPHEKNLTGVFSAYPRFDHLVSVSESLREINERKLGRLAGEARFTSARNTIDHERIRAAADEPLPPGLRLGDDGTYTFVTVGRLSPEKNHARLVAAFAQVHQRHPETRLLVIGEGPLRSALEQQVAALGLTDAVTLAGQLANPWAAMARCSCFVLSSDYEGQPMVILEALVLGLPVVTTAFDSVGSALPEGSGAVVERSVEGLVAGMCAAQESLVPPAPFDAVAYNEEAIAEFERGVGLV